MNYNVHATVGKKKGQFVKQTVKNKTEKFIERVKGKGGRRRIKNTSRIEECTATKDQLQKIDFKTVEGCRIVNVEQLAKTMWCSTCNQPVSLRHVTHEQQQGVATNWMIKCLSCSNTVTVETSKKSNKMYHDSNLKLAIGMLDAGVDETKVNMILSALNIPAVTNTSFN